MPRRNRLSRAKPLDLTPEPAPPRTFGTKLWETPKPAPKAVTERENAERQRAARMNNGIDWSVCLVPGCGKSVHGYVHGCPAPEERDPNTWLPMCLDHASVVAQNVHRWWPNSDIAKAVIAIQERQQQQSERRERNIVVRGQGAEGIVYFLRQNGLIKVGWSSDIAKRMKSYGPSVEVLVTFPGSRHDETNLHRQLRSELAKGREWYHDSAVLQHFIAEALKRHGAPSPKHLPGWTEPRQAIVASKHNKGIG